MIAQLAVGIVLILTTVMVWVVSMYPAAIFWDAIGSQMPRNTHGTMQMLNNVAGWFLILEVVGILVWIGVWAFKKEIVDVPAY